MGPVNSVETPRVALGTAQCHCAVILFHHVPLGGWSGDRTLLSRASAERIDHGCLPPMQPREVMLLLLLVQSQLRYCYATGLILAASMGVAPTFSCVTGRRVHCFLFEASMLLGQRSSSVFLRRTMRCSLQGDAQ